MKFQIVNKFLFIFLIYFYKLVCGQGDEETTTTTEAEFESTTSGIDAPSTTPRYVPYPHGGILVQYTQPGLDYIINMIEKATVKLMREFPIPDADQGSFSVKRIKVIQFDDPKITARFINQTAIEVNTTIPKLVTSAAYSAGSGWFGTSGVVKSNVEGLVISMQAKINRGLTGYPSIGINECAGSVKKFRVAFQDAGWSGTILNSLRSFMESIFVSAMGDVVCFAARNLTGLIETVFLDFDKPMSEILSVAFTPEQQAPAPNALDMKVICGDVPKDDTPVTKRKGAGGIASSVVAEMEGLTLDMKMNDDGHFENDQVIIGLRAGFLHEGKASGLEPKPIVLDKTDRSLCFAVSDIVPSSFGYQGHENGYFVLKKKLEVADFPVEIRTPLRLICGKCNMKFYASTTEAPKVEFARSGVRALTKTFMRIDGQGIFNTKIKVVEAIADIETLINLYIKQNTVYANVSLGSIQIKLNDVGIGGVFDKPFNKLLRNLVPKIIWPVVQKKLNKILIEKGIKLPAVCGLSFNNTQISYTNGHIVICTDFNYDLDGFLHRFTTWQMEQQGINLATTTLGSAFWGTDGEESQTAASEGVDLEGTSERAISETTSVRSLRRMDDDGLTK